MPPRRAREQGRAVPGQGSVRVSLDRPISRPKEPGEGLREKRADSSREGGIANLHEVPLRLPDLREAPRSLLRGAFGVPGSELHPPHEFVQERAKASAWVASEDAPKVLASRGLFALLVVGFIVGMTVLRMPAHLGPIERIRSLTVFEALRATPLAPKADFGARR